MKKILIVFFNFIFLNCLNNQLNESISNITITVQGDQVREQQEKLVLSTEYSGPEIFDDIDIEEKTKFEAIIDDIFNNKNK